MAGAIQDSRSPRVYDRLPTVTVAQLAEMTAVAFVVREMGIVETSWSCRIALSSIADAAAVCKLARYAVDSAPDGGESSAP